ncbi:MAG TPA: CBS domain-containing protein [Nitrososphaerales archaeon]|nr:CBS domain-containing protein [Nitrososphaerales archaeon]
MATIVKISARVKDLMDSKIVTVDADATVAQALKAMLQNDVWSVIVMEKGIPAGVVVEHDVLQRCVGKGLDPNRVKAKDIMSSPLLQIDAEAPIGEAMKKLEEESVKRLYIVQNGKVVGRLTEKSVLEGALNLMMTLSAVTSSA